MGLTLSPTVATSSHGLTTAARSKWESKLHGDTASASSASVSALTISLSVSPLYSLLFFSFFYLGFFALSVTLFGAVCFFFFFNKLPRSWAPRLGGFMGLGLAG